MPSMIDVHVLHLLLPLLLALGALSGPARAQETGRGGEREERPANRLAHETSPYLLAHSHNPVDWYPWGPEALERARKEDLPIFLSIGYSACHWCHVMERESFEDEAIAALMNRWFVCIKVDREERPDLDEIYMAAVQALNDGGGGWPMSVFLTPQLEPFFGGTYYPPRARYGRPGFEDVLKHVHALWTDHRDWIEKAGGEMVAALRGMSGDEAGEAPGRELLALAVQRSRASHDPVHGGFGRPPIWAPKFPHCTELTFLLRHGVTAGDAQAVEMVARTLREMARGGIHDQLAGGFARYSVDRAWTVPHFEKMLYDNAQLAALYTEAWQATGEGSFRRVAEEILDYVRREMTGPEGGFYSSTDADSEGEEGRFFVWSAAEIDEVCGDDAAVARAWFGVTSAGNFEGQNVLTARASAADVAARTGRSVEEVEAAVERCRALLLERRARRVPPHLDDKVLSSWNGLMLSAFARAAAVYGRADYLATARAGARFLLGKMRREDGGLFRTRRGGRSHLDGYLEDHAFVVQGLLDLYEADLDPRWLEAALELHAQVEARFADTERGGYFSFSDAHEALPVRTSSAQDSSLPSDVGVACTNAARLGLLAGDLELVERARSGLRRHAEGLRRWPTAYSELLLLIDFLAGEPPEVFVVGARDDERVARRIRALQRQWPPRRVFALVEPATAAALGALLPSAEGKVARDGLPTVYVCHEGVCQAPQVLRD